MPLAREVILLVILTCNVGAQIQGRRRRSTVPITELHLEGGAGPHEGNVKVEVRGSSHYICDDGFGFAEADLICRELGFDGADRFTKNNHFGINTPEWRRSSQLFLEDRLNCSSTVTSYGDCPRDERNTHNCVASEIAGVECRGSGSQCQPDEFPCRDSKTCIPRDQVCDGVSHCPDDSDDAEDLCSDISVATVKSNTEVNIPGAILGTVQVKYNEEWGAVCDDFLSIKEAQVICRSMGYGTGWSVGFLASYLGEVEGRTLVHRPGCDGHEEWLGQCPDIIWGGASRCLDNSENFGVFCYNQGVEARLVGEDSRNSGRVELKLSGSWGNVCDTGFDIFDARVICRMLGYLGDATAHRRSGRGIDTTWNLMLDCLGGEQDVQECRIRIMNGTCPRSNTAGVTCSQSSGQVEDTLRNALGDPDCGLLEDASNQFLYRLTGKVLGGFIPTRFDTPWLASIRVRTEIGGGRLVCGGVIISEDFVLTASHCFDTEGRLTVVVRVGDHNSDYKEDSEEDFFIEQYWTHEHNNEAATADNDIALVKIQRKNRRGIRFSTRVKPICLPSVSDKYEDLSRCSIAGWGSDFFLGDPSSRPREGRTFVIDDDFCEGRNSPFNYTSSMFCVGRFSPPVSACKGDSGGPFTCLSGDERHTLYGLVSKGKRCVASTAPAIYVRVSKFMDWILEKVQLAQNDRF